VRTVLGLLPSGVKLFAVVKAGGYGHGARPAATAALAAGAYGLGVATVAEAIEVRDLCPHDRILVMGGLLPQEAPAAVESGAALTVSSLSLALALERAADRHRVQVHLKIDTGMGRFGCPPEDAPEIAGFIAASKHLELAGTCSHFSSSDSDRRYTKVQLQRFLAAALSLGVDPGLRHIANSGGALLHPEAALDAVRVGIALYGCEDARVRPVLSLRARIAHLKTVAPGETVGYGRTWAADRHTEIATVTMGYADGVHRARSGHGWALVRGRRAPLVGMVSMDSFTLDVTAVPGVQVGDMVTLVGRDGEGRILAEEVAAWSGTVSYEVLTSIGNRVVRIHRD